MVASKVRVLLIDDDAYIRLFVPDVISSLGWEYVGEARDGAEGIDQFRKLQPDLVLLDQHMPRMNGEAVLKKIIEINPSAFVIMLTSDLTPELVRKLIKNGAKGYIIKSYNLAEMAKLISNVWNNASLGSPC